MRKIAISLAVTASVLLAGPVFASTAAVSPQSGAAAGVSTPASVPATAATPQNTPDADNDPIICKNQPIIGSRLSSRLCMPKHRWAQMHQDGQDFMRNLDERSSGGQERSN